MKLSDLIIQCVEVINRGGEAIVLVIPRGVRLCGRRGPIGELLCTNSNGANVVRFKAKSVLKFLKREIDRE